VQVGDKSLDIQIKYRREGEEIHVKEIDGVDEDGNHINLTDATDPELGDMNEWATKKVECDEDVSEEVREWIREQERKEQADWDRHHPGIGRYRG
jgi:hypothetical protein